MLTQALMPLITSNVSDYKWKQRKSLIHYK